MKKLFETPKWVINVLDEFKFNPVKKTADTETFHSIQKLNDASLYSYNYRVGINSNSTLSIMVTTRAVKNSECPYDDPEPSYTLLFQGKIVNDQNFLRKLLQVVGMDKSLLLEEDIGVNLSTKDGG